MTGRSANPAESRGRGSSDANYSERGGGANVLPTTARAKKRYKRSIISAIQPQPWSDERARMRKHSAHTRTPGKA